MPVPVPPSASQAETRPFLLLELYLDAGTQYLANADRDVTWDGHVYICFPFTIAGVTRTTQGIVDRVQVATSNVTREIAALLLAEKFRGKRILIRRSFFKEDYTIETPLVIFDGLMDDIAGKEGEQNAEIVLSGASDLAFWQKPIPGRTYKATCHWVFKSAGCGYAGAEISCNKSFDRCKALGNTARFAGFRHLPKLETADIWWGKSYPYPASPPRILPQ